MTIYTDHVSVINAVTDLKNKLKDTSALVEVFEKEYKCKIVISYSAEPSYLEFENKNAELLFLIKFGGAE